MSLRGRDEFRLLYVISVAAELAGMHAQTLRQYDRLGLVSPSRTGGGGRRYSEHDIARLRQLQQMSADGVSLAGMQRVLELESQVEALRSRVSELQVEVARLREQASGRVFTASRDGQIVAMRPGKRSERLPAGTSLVLWQPQR
ncbi:heat shock protein transcriptional repressor HspR [Dermacoccaceae bacterium W4C1]